MMTDKPGFFDFAGRRAYNLQRWNAVGWDEIAAFIGPNADRFQEAWENYTALINGEKRFAINWCWPGLLFGFAWFFYRRQWIAGSILLAVPIALGMMLPSHSGMTGFAAALGVGGKHIYLFTAVHKIRKLKEQKLSPADYQNALREAGGVSWLGGTIGGAILLLAIFSLFAGR